MLLVIDQHVDDLAEVERDGPILGRQIVAIRRPTTPGGSSLILGYGDLGSAAKVTRTTRAAYQQAIDLGHPNAAPRAKVNLGNLLTKQGDATGAKAAYQRHRLGHPGAAPHGALRLGMLLADHGEQARTAYQQALSPGSSAVRQEAGQLLARLP